MFLSLFILLTCNLFISFFNEYQPNKFFCNAREPSRPLATSSRKGGKYKLVNACEKKRISAPICNKKPHRRSVVCLYEPGREKPD